MKKLLLYVLSLSCLLGCKSHGIETVDSVDAKFSMYCNQESICVGSEVSVFLSVNAMKRINLSTFKVSIKFDSSIFSFKDVSAVGSINDSELKYNLDGSTLDIIFLTESEGIDLNKNNSMDLLEVDFKTICKTDCSRVIFISEMDGVGDYNEKYLSASKIEDVFVEVVDKPKFDCRLSSLIPIEAELSPEFCPDVYDYTINVPSDFKEIEFETIPIEKEAKVKVNRKTLHKAGEETKIKITVLSPDKKSKLTYRVNVKREPKDVYKGSHESANKQNERKVNSNKSSNKVLDSSTKSNLDIQDTENNEESSKTLIIRENGFSFVMFAVIVFVVMFILFFTRRKHMDKIVRDKQI